MTLLATWGISERKEPPQNIATYQSAKTVPCVVVYARVHPSKLPKITPAPAPRGPLRVTVFLPDPCSYVPIQFQYSYTTAHFLSIFLLS